MKKIITTTIALCLSVTIGYSQTIKLNSINNPTPSIGEIITLYGSGFGTSLDDISISLDGTIVSPTQVKDSEILFTVPSIKGCSNVRVINTATKVSSQLSVQICPAYRNTNVIDFTDANTAAVARNAILAYSYFDLVDLDDDGKVEIVGFGEFQGIGVSKIENSVIQSPISLNGNGKPIDMEIADFDYDGIVDILVLVNADKTSGGSEFLYFKNQSNAGTFAVGSVKTISIPNKEATSFAVADFNNNGKLQLAITQANTPEIQFYTISGSSTLTLAEETSVSVNGKNSLTNILAADLNKDGKIDLACHESNISNVSILPNTSSSTTSFETALVIPVAGKLTSLLISDLNKDDFPEIIVSKKESNNLTIVENKSVFPGGEIKYSSNQRNLESGAEPTQTIITNFNGDEFRDIVATSSSNNISIFKGEGNLAFKRNDVLINSSSQAIQSADIDQDGRTEIVLGSRSGTNIIIVNDYSCPTFNIKTDAPFDACKSSFFLEVPNFPDATYQWFHLDSPINGATSPKWAINRRGAIKARVTFANNPSCSFSTPAISFNSSSTTSMSNSASNKAAVTGCQGQTLTLSPDVKASHYHWVGPNGFESDLESPSIPNLSLLNAGLYTLFKYNNTCNPDGIENHPVNIVKPLGTSPLSIQPRDGRTLICKRIKTALDANNVPTGANVTWYINGEEIGANDSRFEILNNTKTLETNIPGTYTISETTNGGSCNPSSDPVVVSELNETNITITENVKCAGSTSNFSIATIDGIDPTKLSAKWDFKIPNENDPNQTTSVEKTGFNVDIVFDRIGNINYTVNVSFADQENACNSVFKNAAISVDDNNVTTSFSPETGICNGEEATLTINGVKTVTWQAPLNGNQSDKIVTKPGTYTADIVTQQGCTETITLTVPSRDQLDLTLSSNASSYFVNTPVTFNIVQNQTPIIEDLNYTWSADPNTEENGFESTSLETLTYTPQAEGMNTISVEVSAPNSPCPTIKSLTINVKPEGEKPSDPPVFPEFISVGNGDTWNIRNITSPIDKASMKIIDKQGRTVYETDDYDNKPWNGTSSMYNQSAREGVYFYIMEYKKKKFVGTVSILTP